MTPIWNKHRHWEKRAEEARAIADAMTNERNRITLLAIAREYDELAALARAAENDTKPRYAYYERG